MSYGRARFNRSPSCIYVGNLPDDVKEKEIEDIFYKFGRMRDIDVKRGRTTNGTAYAFVEFENIRDAEDAVERRDGYVFCHNRLRVEFTGERRPKRRGEGSSNGPPQRNKSLALTFPINRTDFRVIVSNLPVGCRWQHLKDHMRSAGDVGYANVEMGKGVVEYLKYDDMTYALENLDRTELSAYDVSSVIKVRRDDERSGNSRDYGYHRKRSRSRSVSRSKERRPHEGGKRYSRSPAGDRHRKRDSRSPAYRDENGRRSRSHSSANSRYSSEYDRSRRSNDQELPEDRNEKDTLKRRTSAEKDLRDSREDSQSPRDRTPEEEDARMREEASPVEEIAA